MTDSNSPSVQDSAKTAGLLGIDREDGSLMLALSTASSRAPATKPRPWFDVMSVVARRKLNAPPEWQWFSARVLSPTDDTLIEGAVPNRRKDGTPRKGRERWTGVEGQSCVVTRAEIAAALAEYEATTGKCHECAGCGERIASAGRDGTRYKTCRRCGGSGCASVVLAVDRSRFSPNHPTGTNNDVEVSR